MKGQKGYSSVTVFIIVLFLSTLTLSLIYFLQTSSGLGNRYAEYYRIRAELEDEVELLISELLDDPTPEADSPFDPVWSYVETRNHSDITLHLNDLSSRFNLNFIRTKMLEESELSKIMIKGNDPEKLKLYRGENGFFSDQVSGYGDYFKKDDLEKYFTSYSYANFNVTYEDSLKKLFEIRVSEEGGLSFLNTVQQHISGKTMADRAEFRKIAGTSYKQLFPVINTESLMNVHFIPELNLKAVLFYPYGGTSHKDSSSFYEIIIAERASFEYSSSRLDNLLELDEDYRRIREYLGTRTWFWKISVEKAEHILEVIICMFPEETDGDKQRKLQILQWKYL